MTTRFNTDLIELLFWFDENTPLRFDEEKVASDQGHNIDWACVRINLRQSPKSSRWSVSVNGCLAFDSEHQDRTPEQIWNEILRTVKNKADQIGRDALDAQRRYEELATTHNEALVDLDPYLDQLKNINDTIPHKVTYRVLDGVYYKIVNDDQVFKFTLDADNLPCWYRGRTSVSSSFLETLKRAHTTSNPEFWPDPEMMMAAFGGYTR